MAEEGRSLSWLLFLVLDGSRVCVDCVRLGHSVLVDPISDLRWHFQKVASLPACVILDLAQGFLCICGCEPSALDPHLELS